ncbi:MAG: hypothetical protein ACE5K4_10675 [Candidatus Hydrothermarchaeota archaeon]
MRLERKHEKELWNIALNRVRKTKKPFLIEINEERILVTYGEYRRPSLSSKEVFIGGERLVVDEIMEIIDLKEGRIKHFRL